MFGDYDFTTTQGHVDAVLEATAYGPRTTEEVCQHVADSVGCDLLEAVKHTTGILVAGPASDWAGRRRQDGRMEWGQIASYRSEY